MTTPSTANRPLGRLNRAAGLLVVLWTACIASSLLWNLHEQKDRSLEMARNTAELTSGKDIRGGVSVSVPLAPLHAIAAPLTRNLILAHLAQSVAGLQAANQDLASFNRVAVGRELRMVELKRQVNELCAEAGLPARYEVDAGAPR